MTREEAIAIIRKEYLCVDRDCDIERSCGKCDLMMPSKEPILQAYKMAIKALDQESCEDAVNRTELKKWLDMNFSFGGALRKLELFDRLDKELPPVNPQPCENAIGRQAALKTLDDMDNVLDEDRTIENYKELLKECYEVLPPVTSQPKMGRWIHREDLDFLDENKVIHRHYMCQDCGFIHDFLDDHTTQYNYCPSCGLKMVEPHERSGKE